MQVGEVCEHIRHYYRRNGYLPSPRMTLATEEELRTLEHAGLVVIRRDPPLSVSLTLAGDAAADGWAVSHQRAATRRRRERERGV